MVLSIHKGKKPFEAPDLMLAPELDDEMLSEPSDESIQNSKSDLDFSTQQSKKVPIEKIKEIKSTRSEIISKNVTLSKICDDTDENCDCSVTNTTLSNHLHQNQSIANKRNDKDVKLNSGIEKKYTLKVRKVTKTHNVKSHT